MDLYTDHSDHPLQFNARITPGDLDDRFIGESSLTPDDDVRRYSK